ncbi:hypothetical protein AKJ18_11115 [Vibrio xuii]|nr:hypothetical protein AKJ18_11115 [Vibrio xuii]
MNDQVFEALNYKAAQECPHFLKLVIENEAKEGIAINVRARELIKRNSSSVMIFTTMKVVFGLALFDALRS